MLDTIEDIKHAMLTSMTNSIMNVTYHHQTNLPTISPFGIDGNIDEKHLVPKMPTKAKQSSHSLHQSYSLISIPQ